MPFGMRDEFDWQETIQAKRIAMTSDQTVCGHIIAEYKDSIIIIEFDQAKLNEYIIPKSRVDHYDGRNVRLSVSGNLLSSFCF